MSSSNLCTVHKHAHTKWRTWFKWSIRATLIFKFMKTAQPSSVIVLADMCSCLCLCVCDCRLVPYQEERKAFMRFQAANQRCFFAIHITPKYTVHSCKSTFLELTSFPSLLFSGKAQHRKDGTLIKAPKLNPFSLLLFFHAPFVCLAAAVVRNVWIPPLHLALAWLFLYEWMCILIKFMVREGWYHYW